MKYDLSKKEERMFFDANSKAEWDYKRSIDYAAEEAAQQAKEEERILFATKLLEKGYEFDEISELTELPINTIMNL